MNILLTGNEGYIGSVLGPLLINAGYMVVGLDTGFYKDRKLFNSINIRTIIKDTREVEANDLQNFDAVIHLAELSNDPLGKLNPDITYEINYRGTVSLAEKCKAAGIKRFVYSSSCSVYGTDTDEYKREASKLNPLTTYSTCKALVEKELMQLASENFSPIVLRLATVYGPSPRMRFDTVFNNLAGSAWTQGIMNLTSDGTPWRPLVHIRDVCEAFKCMIGANMELVHGQIFNVGNTKENYQIQDVVELLATTFLNTKYSIGNMETVQSYRVSFEKIKRNIPNFSCSKDIKMGASEFIELFKDINLSFELFMDKNFTRLEKIKSLITQKRIDSKLYWNVDQI